MEREDAIPYISFIIDTALSADHTLADVDDHATLVGWQCGFEPLFVAIIGDTVDAEEAEEIAVDYLVERNWFSGEPYPADYILCPERAKTSERFVSSYCNNCGHMKALHLAYGPNEPPEACRGACGSCQCDAFEAPERAKT